MYKAHSAFFAALLATAATPAWAVYNQTLVLTGTDAQAVPATSISFTAASGQTVQVQDNDDSDDGIFVLVFPGDSGEGGTLTITRSDGSKTNIMVPPAQPGEHIRVNLDNGTARRAPDSLLAPAPTTVASEPAMPSAYLIGTYDSIKVPQVGAGTLIGADSEEFIGLSKKRLTGWSGTGILTFPETFGGNVSIGFSYGEADGNSSGSVAAGAANVGIVYHDFSPNESTGVAVGAAGMDVSTRSELDHMLMFAKFELPGGNNGGDVSPYGKLFYGNYKQRHSSFVETPTYGSAITSESNQRVKEDLFGLELGLRFDTDNNGVRIGLGGGIMGYYRDAKLRSSQHNICSLCPSPDQQDFTINIEDSDDGFGFGASLMGNVGLGLADGIEVGLLGALRYMDKIGRVWNPMSGNDLFLDNNPTHLESGSSTSWHVGGYLRFDF
jgi:hypothetical protein